jgi:dipeptidyl aminopeptidase/acylaminoacyl peptidase
MLEQIKTMKYKKQYAYIAGGGVILAILYILISVYITSLAYKTIINMPEISPKDYGLEYEKVEFQTTDNSGLILRGWWIPNESKNTIIYLHGIDSNRAGHSSEQTIPPGLEVLKHMHSMGYSIFTFDLRGHGVSDTAKVGLGVKEIADIKGAINYLESTKNVEKVALYGISYGAVLAILAGNADDNVKGIFIDSPYNMITDLITGEIPRRTPIPGFIAGLLSQGIVWSSIWLEGINLNEIKPYESIKDLKYPVLMVHCKDDKRIPIYHSDQINENAPLDTLYHKFENCDGHGKAYESNKTYYLGFAKTYFNRIFQ